jgi:hypothetical protein
MVFIAKLINLGTGTMTLLMELLLISKHAGAYGSGIKQ